MPNFRPEREDLGQRILPRAGGLDQIVATPDPAKDAVPAHVKIVEDVHGDVHGKAMMVVMNPAVTADSPVLEQTEKQEPGYRVSVENNGKLTIEQHGMRLLVEVKYKGAKGEDIGSKFIDPSVQSVVDLPLPEDTVVNVRDMNNGGKTVDSGKVENGKLVLTSAKTQDAKKETVKKQEGEFEVDTKPEAEVVSAETATGEAGRLGTEGAAESGKEGSEKRGIEVAEYFRMVGREVFEADEEAKAEFWKQSVERDHKRAEETMNAIRKQQFLNQDDRGPETIDRTFAQAQEKKDSTGNVIVETSTKGNEKPAEVIINMAKTPVAKNAAAFAPTTNGRPTDAWSSVLTATGVIGGAGLVAAEPRETAKQAFARIQREQADKAKKEQKTWGQRLSSFARGAGNMAGKAWEKTKDFAPPVLVKVVKALLS